MSVSWGGEEQEADEVYRYRWSGETACAEEIAHSSMGCMLPDVRQHAEQMKTEDRWVWRKRQKHLVMLCLKKKKKKKPLMVEWAHWRRYNGKTHPDSHVDFHLTTAKWGTREHAGNEKCLVQKENNLLSVASIHFHSEGQELFLDNRVMKKIAGIDWQKTATKVLNKHCAPYKNA